MYIDQQTKPHSGSDKQDDFKIPLANYDAVGRLLGNICFKEHLDLVFQIKAKFEQKPSQKQFEVSISVICRLLLCKQKEAVSARRSSVVRTSEVRPKNAENATQHSSCVIRFLKGEEIGISNIIDNAMMVVRVAFVTENRNLS